MDRYFPVLDRDSEGMDFYQGTQTTAAYSGNGIAAPRMGLAYKTPRYCAWRYPDWMRFIGFIASFVGATMTGHGELNISTAKAVPDETDLEAFAAIVRAAIERVRFASHVGEQHVSGLVIKATEELGCLGPSIEALLDHRDALLAEKRSREGQA